MCARSSSSSPPYLRSSPSNIATTPPRNSFCPRSRLPEVKRLAPEFYDDLPQCPSWPGMVLRFIFDDKVTLYSRMKRVARKED